MPTSDAVLVVNSGSSSIKFGVFDASHADPALLCKAQIDEHEGASRLVFTDPAGRASFALEQAEPDASPDRLFADVLARIEHHLGERLRAVGHRVVHGGREFPRPVEVNRTVLAVLDALTPLAPLHQPRCLTPIRAISAIRPELMQVACFDTSFHHGIAPPVNRFAIPRHLERAGIRRYGFHGLSFEYVAGRLADISPEFSAKRTVVAHLGNGASLCALRDGRSIDTTMGLTPLDGLVMGTRCGTIDPGVLLYLQQRHGMSVDDLEQLLYHQSGLLGVSGVSSDMRVLLASQEPAAKEAVDLFAFRIAQQVAAMAGTLGGLDCLVFTGGIGEHASEVRTQVCDQLGWLGVQLDPSANTAAQLHIACEDSSVDVLVMATNEEAAIARHCAALISGT
ncbi:acetate/propionate family kinase [Bradyrhizobium sp. BEA-2-5]|uniref:acetate/propionate family kinase n=1 Tax=Bradyrhizobium sp. BEA-2-5 TaxID=3080015 RepID=UPI00293E7CF1|nr:acetate/propionate family kinase [Bradyrhizobium sp. BEA-2-5]WOH78381.1 acetate/propionate family kinase [Bradyrhizobium sp. BEA-2-5]